MSPTWNEDGYPPQHYDQVRRARRYARNAALITGVPFLLLLLGSVFGPVPAALPALAAAVFLIFGLVGAAGSLYDAQYHAQIHPYFQRSLGDIDTFLAGKALVRYLRQLDAAATELGVKRLSEFGFNDDLRGEKLEWHSPKEGLATVDALLRWLADDADVPTAIRAALNDDLVKWRHALARADSHGVSFCLLLRHCNATSGHEWDVRQGSAF